MSQNFSEFTLIFAALQIFGAMMGALQGAMKAWIGRLGSRPRRNKGWQSGSMQFSAILTIGLAIPTLLSALGAPESLAILAMVVNMVLPLIGNLLFIFPAWMFFSRLTELLLQPVDATA